MASGKTETCFSSCDSSCLRTVVLRIPEG
jgi:hypothetical protein